MHRVVAHREAGRTMDWEDEWTPEDESFFAISRIYSILLARARFNLAFYERDPEHEAMVTDETTAGDRRETDAAGNARRAKAFPAGRTVVFHRKETPIRPGLVGHDFKIRVYDTRRESLASELAAYYAPVLCQSEPTFADRDPRTQRKDIQRQRRQRWAKRERSALWSASDYIVTDTAS